MAALDYLRRAGLTVEAAAGKLRVLPVERFTPELEHFIVENKVELLIELEVRRAEHNPNRGGGAQRVRRRSARSCGRA